MKLIFVSFLFLFGVALSAYTQPGRTLPYWVTQLPNADTYNHYYYRVTMAESSTYDKAYAGAFAKAVMEAKYRA